MTDLSAEPVFVGLGSNMARPEHQLLVALELLGNKPGIELRRQSALYHSPPWGEPDQPDFINAVVQITTTLDPVRLLNVLTGIEDAMGRVRNGLRWGPRIMDLDLLAFGQRVINTRSLTLPHPRIADRAFVLVPFAEIAPEFQLPGMANIKQLLTQCNDAGTIRRLNRGKQEHV